MHECLSHAFCQGTIQSTDASIDLITAPLFHQNLKNVLSKYFYFNSVTDIQIFLCSDALHNIEVEMSSDCNNNNR